MDITVKGLRHPHRYVLDAAQTHIYMLMKKVGGICAADPRGPGSPSLPRHPESSLDTGEKGRCYVATALLVLGCRIVNCLFYLSTGQEPP